MTEKSVYVAVQSAGNMSQMCWVGTVIFKRLQYSRPNIRLKVSFSLGN